MTHPSCLSESKNGIGKAEAWDILCCRFVSRMTAEIARKQVCLHGPFGFLLNHWNGNPADPAPGEQGKSAIRSFFLSV